MTNVTAVRMRRFAAGCALLAAAVALVAIVGHATRQPALAGLWQPGKPGMAPFTALALLACSGALLLRLGSHLRLMQATLVPVALAAAAVLGSYVLHGTDAINPVLIAALSGDMPLQGLRTSWLTAACLAVWALGMWLGARGNNRATAWGAGFVLLVSGTVWLNDLYSAEGLRLLPPFDTMSLHTAAALFLLGLALLFVDPQRGPASIIGSANKAGGATRRQLALLLAMPLVGLLLNRLFDAGLLQQGAMLALLVMGTVAPFAVLILRDGRVLDALERAQQDKAQLATDFNSQLQSQLQERTSQLEAAHADKLLNQSRQQQSQRMETVGQLTGGIAHDFNNLLQAINGRLELAMRHSHEPGKLREDVEHAQASVWRASKLSTKLLAFSRTQDLAIRPISIGAAMQGARQLISGSLGPDVDIALQLPDKAGDLHALADTDQLEHALLNLALNAGQAMPGGGRLTLTVSVVQRVLQPWSPPAEYVSIKVSDTGVGMPPDVLSRAAEPFFTTREPGTASGLGLAQVYGFAVQCNGSLDIQSTPGQGTTVELLLRRADAPPPSNAQTAWQPSAGAAAPFTPASQAPAPQAAAPSPPAPKSRRSVLVIDDDDDVRATLVAVLEYEGYRVLAAANGAEGLALLEQEQPEVLVVDFIMPGLNGAEVARRARRLRPGLPVVFVSGYSDTAELASIPHAAVVGKPFDVDRLVQAVESVV